MEDIKHYQNLIIGADAAGLSAAVQIHSNQKEATIGVLDKGEIISYGACGLPYAIEGKIESFEKLVHYTPAKFSDKFGADVRTGVEVTNVDFDSRKVQAQNDGAPLTFSYDRLLIATGAEPVRIPGIDYSSPRVFELKTVPDGRKIHDAIHSLNVRKVLIIGAGYIGLELADAFHNLGLEVTLMDMEERPVPRMAEDIGHAISKKCEENEIRLHLKTGLKELILEENSILARSEDLEIRADIVVVAVGIRPATGFLKDSGLTLDRGAVVVDRQGKTNISEVYSAGDCAVVYHNLLEKNTYRPLGSTANKQGRIAGINMSGGNLEFPGIIGAQTFKFFNLGLAQTGLSMEEAREAGYDPVMVGALRTSKAGYYPGAEKTTIHMIVDQNSGVILGGHYIGPVDSTVMIDTVGVMAQMRMKANDAAYFDSVYAPPVAPVWNALISAAGKFAR